MIDPNMYTGFPKPWFPNLYCLKIQLLFDQSVKESLNHFFTTRTSDTYGENRIKSAAEMYEKGGGRGRRCMR